MLKSQVIIIIAAIIAVIFLFNLPKYIVKDERQTKSELGQSMTGPEKAEEAHDLTIDEKDLKIVTNFTKSYLSVSDTEKKVKFADSLAVIYRRLHKYDSSAKYLGEIASLKPEKRNYIKAGDAFFDASTFALDQQKSGNLGEKAREYYQKVLDGEPSNLEVKTKLAKTYIGTNDPQNTMKGVRMLKEVVKEDQNNEEALYNLGILSIQSKQFNKAVERFEVILKNNPNHLESQFRLGYSYMMLGEKQKARDSFEKVKKLSQDPQVQSTVDTYLKELNN